MTKEEKLKALRVKLYKATPLKLDLVDQLINAIKHSMTRFEGVEVDSITFKPSTFKLGGLYLKSLNLDEISGVLVHWYPNFRISTQSDPYCSAYILTPREIRRIIKKVTEVKEYYNSHQPK